LPLAGAGASSIVRPLAVNWEIRTSHRKHRSGLHIQDVPRTNNRPVNVVLLFPK
jgi:hypothetical protein